MAVDVFTRALALCDGNQSKLAKELETSQAHVWHRLNKSKDDAPIPPKWVLHLERITGTPRHEIRPDLYPRDEAA